MYVHNAHVKTLINWKEMQTTSRMTVNVFNLVNGSYKSKHWQKPQQWAYFVKCVCCE